MGPTSVGRVRKVTTGGKVALVTTGPVVGTRDVTTVGGAVVGGREDGCSSVGVKIRIFVGPFVGAEYGCSSVAGGVLPGGGGSVG